MGGKKGQVWESLIPWLIGIGVLILIFGLYFIFSKGGLEIIDKIKSFFRFGK